MNYLPNNWRRRIIRIVGALSLPCLLSLEIVAAPPQAPAVAPAAPAVAETAIPVFTLADCIHLALDQQPTLAANRASLAVAQHASQTLQNMRVPPIISAGRELQVRRQQACLGKTAASAALNQSEHDTIYAVTRNYYSVIFAREQRKVVQQVVDELQTSLNLANDLLGKPGAPRDLTQNSVDRNKVYLRLAQIRLDEADRGMGQALAALREAMGGCVDLCFNLAPDTLPQPAQTFCKDEIVALAIARRGELVQASTLAHITCLETSAQGTSHKFKMQTFAAGADIHSKGIPTDNFGDNYRPGAVGPEMPSLLAGPRADRMERARILAARAAAVTDKTRNLICLEAEDAFLRWQEAYNKVPKTREASEIGGKLAKNTLDDFKSGQNVPYKDVLETVVVAATAKASYNEALYHQALGLAALERVTAGGVCAGQHGLVTPARE
jgi:outer membrane protein TolC